MGVTYIDTVYVSGMLLALRLQAKFAAPGAMQGNTVGMTLHFGVLFMAGVDPQQRELPPEAATIWRCFGEWLEHVYLSDADPRRRDAVGRLFVDGMAQTCEDVSWIGDPIKTYTKAAAMRGGWRRVLELAHQQGAVTGSRPADDELYEFFEAHRMAMPNGGLARTKGGRILPNAGGALDSFLGEAEAVPGTGNPVPEDAEDTAQALGAVEQAHRERLIRQIHERIRAIPARSQNSRSSRLIAEHRLALYRGEITPERVAALAHVPPSPLHREWRREQLRVQQDPEVVRLKRALGDPG